MRQPRRHRRARPPAAPGPRPAARSRRGWRGSSSASRAAPAADVELLDAEGAALQDTDPDAVDAARRRPRRPRPGRAGTNRASEFREADRDRDAIVVTPVATHAGPVTLVLTQAAERQPRGGRRDARRPAARRARRADDRAAPRDRPELRASAAPGAPAPGRAAARRGPASPSRSRATASRDEVGDLARALESMRARLQAEERSRQAFLGTASHELRTPLALLQATVELMDEALAAPVPDVENARRGAPTAGRQTRRLARLATDLLDLSRLDGEVAAAPRADRPARHRRRRAGRVRATRARGRGRPARGRGRGPFDGETRVRRRTARRRT